MKKILILLMLLLVCHSLNGAYQQHAGAGEWRCELVTDLYVGVELEEMTTEERMACGSALPVGCAVKVVKVEFGSPAAAAGVQVGDVLVRFHMSVIKKRVDVVNTMKLLQPGHVVNVGVFRDGEILYFPITIGARKTPAVIGEVTMHPTRIKSPEKAAEYQRNIGMMLSEEQPNLNAVQTVFDEIAKLLSTRGNRGVLRIAYSANGETISVCRFPLYVEVMVETREAEPVRYVLRQQGDALPLHVREMLKRFAQD